MISGTVVKCLCGYRFCFSCHKEAHSPASCADVKQWAKKCKDDSETANWIVVNTQDCPNCRSAIEKNGGCNHMTCMKCKHEFCWICRGDWKKHSACNTFKENEGEKAQSRVSLERYLHYYHRYSTHENSKKFETQLREKAICIMVQLREEESYINVQYIDTATEQLIECRRHLKYTYVYAYYLPDGAEKTLFEYLQAELERQTEELSETLEKPHGWNEKSKVIDLTRAAEKRLIHLLDGVSNGLTTDPSVASTDPQVKVPKPRKVFKKKSKS